MRFGFKFVCVVALVFAAVFDVAAQRNPLIDAKTIDFKLDFFEAPNLPITGGVSVPSLNPKWLVAIITYTPVAAYENSGGRNAKKRVRWLDDLTVELSLIIPGGGNYGDYILLSGKEVLWSVPCDGRRHRVLFAVPPLVFTRYSSLEKFTKATAGEIPAYVEFKSKNQEILARYVYAKANAQRTYQIFQRMFNAQVGVFKLPTAVLPKEKTPWNLVETGAFDLPKSIVEGK